MSLQRRAPMGRALSHGRPKSKALSERAEFDPAWLKELLSDAEAFGRLTDWEEEFIGSTRDRFLQYGENLFLSDRQLVVYQFEIPKNETL